MPKDRKFGIPIDEIKDDIRQAIEGDAEKLVTTAKRIGRDLVSKELFDKRTLSTRQIRNIFGEVKRIETEVKHKKTSMQQISEYIRKSLTLLKPRLAYAAGRHGGAVRSLRDVLVTAIDEVDNNPDKFRNFVNFFEAILAYHREAGGD